MMMHNTMHNDNDGEYDDNDDNDDDDDDHQNTHQADEPSSNNNFRIRFIQVFVPMEGAYEANMAIADQIGNVEVGVDDFDTVASKVQNVTSVFCPICQDTCNDPVFRRTVCGHDFCETCLTTWFKSNKKCPVCMIDVTETNKEAPL